MKTRKDFAGNELKLEDPVVYVEPYRKELKKGFIAKFTPKMITIVDQVLNPRYGINRYNTQVMLNK
jgi:hypothetical protein